MALSVLAKESEGMMSDHRYKKVAPSGYERIAQYHPAAAVKARGDSWINGDEVWNMGAQMVVALRERTQDQTEFCLMRMFERGQLPRCE